MAFYRRNIGRGHQAARLVLALGLIAAGFLLFSGMSAWAIAVTGIAMALTGIVGWCPACALAGIGKETR